MVRTDQTAEYHQARKRLKDDVTTGKIHPEDADRLRNFVDAFDSDAGHVQLPDPTDLYTTNEIAEGDHPKVKPRSMTTRINWLNGLRPFAHALRLTDATHDDINRLTTKWKRNGRYATNTLRGREHSLKLFYRYHADLLADPTEIYIHTQEKDENGNVSKWDRRDILTTDEVRALKHAAEHPRDKAVFCLLYYTGMRNSALRKLKLRDIDLENGEYYFNREASQQKNLHRIEEPRPLLLAANAVREWLDYHPAWNSPNDYDPDAYLVTRHPRYARVDPSTPVNADTPRNIMGSLTDRANDAENGATITKPIHPHMMRHNFVTQCLINTDLRDKTIKFLIGHHPESDVLETTYGHIGTADHRQAARKAFDLEDEPPDETDNPFAPDRCEICGRDRRPGAKRCDRCGHHFDPESFATEKGIENVLWNTKSEATGDTEAGVDVAREILENDPAAKEAIMADLKEELKSDILSELR